ncbi:MAG TPA: HAD-IA family hydrolase [Azospirillum sp.]|nr:HAD-IA family hydrolase [Azospirillum sp.]
MSYPDLISLEPHIRSSKGLAIDLDGTLMSGGRLYPDARRFLESLDIPFMILSNDSEHTAMALVQTFRQQGLVLHASQFILAGVALIEEFAKAEPGARVMLLGSSVLQALAIDLGLILTDDRPTVVMVMRDPDFNYQRLTAAARAIHQGARMVVACPDVSHPSPTGAPVPEAGALAAAIQTCVGLKDYQIFGKPEPAMFKLATQRLGIPPSACAMIGDNPDTDGMGARRSGMAFHHISRPKEERQERAA